MKRQLAALMAIALVVCGCGRVPTPGGGSEHGPPWVTLNEDKFSANTSGPAMVDGKALKDEDGNDVLRFTSKNSEFACLLQNISENFKVAILVRPKDLADRGINVDVQGSSAQAVLADVAKQCKLQLEPVDKKWRLSAPDSEKAAEKEFSP